MLSYTRKTRKDGNRYFFTDGFITNIQYYSKAVSHIPFFSSNGFGKYSLNLSEENVMPQSLVGNHPEKILFKHRIRIRSSEYTNWELDITCTRVCDPNEDTIARTKKDFLKIHTISDLIQNIQDNEFCLYVPSVEIEHVPYGHYNTISSNDIKNVSILPYKLECTGSMDGGRATDNDLLFQLNINELANLLEPINTTLRNRKSRAKNIKMLLPQVVGLNFQEYTAIFPPTNYLLTDKANGTRAMVYFKKIRQSDTIKGYLFYEGNNTIELIYNGKKSTIKTPLLLDCEFIDHKELIDSPASLCFSI